MKLLRATVGLALLAGLFGCKTSGTASDASVKAFGQEPAPSGEICCAFTSDKGVFYETSRCGSGDARTCCEGVWRNLNAWTASYQFAYPFACDAAPPEALSQVSVCRGATRFAEGAPGVGHISDAVSGTSKLAHVWVKTSNIEVGMGPIQAERPGDDAAFGRLMNFLTAKSIRDKVQVAWSDHTGYSELNGATCSRLYLCDEACVEQEMQIGKRLGVYSIINQCHISAVRVLRKCGCFNHCIATIPGTNTCAKRVFPELRGLGLTETGDDANWDWREDYLVDIP